MEYGKSVMVPSQGWAIFGQLVERLFFIVTNEERKVAMSGLYYKHITIVIDAASVVSKQIVASLSIVIDDAS